MPSNLLNSLHQFSLSVLLFSIYTDVKGTQSVDYKSVPNCLIMFQDTISNKYLEQLNSPNAQIRSDAAVMLCKLKHPEAINACIKTINDLPDKDHFDYTPSVHCLIGIGEQAFIPLIDLINSTDKNTRLHACTAIDAITYNIWKTKYKDKQTTDKEFKKWWKEIGLNDEGSAKEREESIRKLNEWLSKRNKK